MGRTPCCEKQGLKKGPWTPEEDKNLVDYIQAHGHGSWRSLPKLAGLLRCGKSCRLRWTNYLRPDIKRGPFTAEEQKTIIQLHGIVGNKWSTIAAQLPGRTDNEIKNYWNTHLKKQLLRMGLNPDTYSATATSSSAAAATRHMAQWESARLEAEARLSHQSLLFSTSSSTDPSIAAATNSSTATVAGAVATSSSPSSQLHADFFLRMWNSDVGNAFRRSTADNSLNSSSTTKLMNAAVDAAPADENKSYGSSNVSGETSVTFSSYDQAEDAAEETYRLYLDFAGNEVGLFNCQLGGLSLFGDINEESFDTAFR